MEDGMLQEEPTLEGGQKQGLRHENLNVIERKRGGNDLKDANGDEKMVEGEWVSPARWMH